MSDWGDSRELPAVEPLPEGYCLDGRFRIRGLRRIDGSGIEYLVSDEILGRKLVGKEFAPAGVVRRDGEAQLQVRDPEFEPVFRSIVQQVREEAQLMARLEHPVTGSLTDCFQANGSVYRIFGPSDVNPLDYLIEYQSLDFGEDELIGDLLGPLLDGLTMLHEQGIIHGNISTENIFATESGEVLLGEMAGVKLLSFEWVQNGRGCFNPIFAAPENREVRFTPTAQPHLTSLQFDPDRGPSSDIYSLAGVAIHAITGKLPASATDRASGKVEETPLRENPALLKKFNARLLAAIDHGFKLQPADRPQSIEEWREELQSGSIEEETRISGSSKGVQMSAELPSDEDKTRLLPRPVYEPDPDYHSDQDINWDDTRSVPPMSRESVDDSRDDTCAIAPMSREDADRSQDDVVRPPENVQFTTYRPRSLVPGNWKDLLVFTHLDDDEVDLDAGGKLPIEEVRDKARSLLGDQIEQYLDTTKDSQVVIARESEITIKPEIPGVRVNPPNRSFFWREGKTSHLEQFEICLTEPELLGRGEIVILIGPLIAATIPLRFQVEESRRASKPPAESDRARVYQKVFPSYSRKDLQIVQSVEGHVRTMGHTYLRDLTTLRAGEDWWRTLQVLIAEADVFQLFWSNNSRASEVVQQEIDFALSLRRDNFIRPTYWEEPIPEAPERLRNLHFFFMGVEREVKKVPEVFRTGSKRNNEETLREIEDGDEDFEKYFDRGNEPILPCAPEPSMAQRGRSRISLVFIFLLVFGIPTALLLWFFWFR